MATIGPTAAKVTPIITGSRMPNHWVAPKDWISVTMPQTNRSAEIRKATSAGSSFSARPDDQRHGDGAGIHHQHMLQAKGEQLWRGENLVHRMGCVCHVFVPSGLCVHAVCAPPHGCAIRLRPGSGPGDRPGLWRSGILRGSAVVPMRSTTAKRPGACKRRQDAVPGAAVQVDALRAIGQKGAGLPGCPADRGRRSPETGARSSAGRPGCLRGGVRPGQSRRAGRAAAA